MRPFAPALLPALAFAVAFPQGALAEGGVGNGFFDLSLYAPETRFGSWQVACTAPGTASRQDQTRDCLLEEDSGLVIFVYPSGYYVFTLRDPGPGDMVLGWVLEGEPFGGVIVTYFGPGFTEDHIEGMTITRSGQEITIAEAGYGEAEALALRLSRGEAP